MGPSRVWCQDAAEGIGPSNRSQRIDWSLLWEARGSVLCDNGRPREAAGQVVQHNSVDGPQYVWIILGLAPTLAGGDGGSSQRGHQRDLCQDGQRTSRASGRSNRRGECAEQSVCQCRDAIRRRRGRGGEEGSIGEAATGDADEANEGTTSSVQVQRYIHSCR